MICLTVILLLLLHHGHDRGITKNLTLTVQNRPHTSHSRTSYGVEIVEILETIARGITALH